MTLIKGYEYVLVYSAIDLAGKGVAEILRDYYKPLRVKCDGRLCVEELTSNAVLLRVSDDIIYTDWLRDIIVDSKAIIMLSRHASSSRIRTLSIHYPGNPTSEASYGGNPSELSWSYPSLAKRLLLCYLKEAEVKQLLKDYKLTLEATHHGPTSLRQPVIFIEIGSDESAWRDRRAQEAMAMAVIEALEKGPVSCKPVVGLGGTHYPEKYTRLMIESDLCYGHILAKYVLKQLNARVLEQAILKSVDRIEAITYSKIPASVRELASAIAQRYGVKLVKV